MIVDSAVELGGGYARDDVGDEPIEDFGGETAGRAHAREGVGAMKLDDAVAGFDPVIIGDSDIFGHRP